MAMMLCKGCGHLFNGPGHVCAGMFPTSAATPAGTAEAPQWNTVTFPSAAPGATTYYTWPGDVAPLPMGSAFELRMCAALERIARVLEELRDLQVAIAGEPVGG